MSRNPHYNALDSASRSYLLQSTRRPLRLIAALYLPSQFGHWEEKDAGPFRPTKCLTTILSPTRTTLLRRLLLFNPVSRCFMSGGRLIRGIRYASLRSSQQAGVANPLMAIILKHYIKLGSLFHRPVKNLVEKDFQLNISGIAGRRLFTGQRLAFPSYVANV